MISACETNERELGVVLTVKVDGPCWPIKPGSSILQFALDFDSVGLMTNWGGPSNMFFYGKGLRAFPTV